MTGKNEPPQSTSKMSQINEDACLGLMTYRVLYSTVLDKLEQDAKSREVVRQLRSALLNADRTNPSFLLKLAGVLAERTGFSVNMQHDAQESLLRLQSSAPQDDLHLEARCPEYVELSNRAKNLRKVLARVPDEMPDRRTFLETIKQIASSIRKLLDATTAILQVVPSNARPAVERRKREFVHYSKVFSNILKDYFRDQNGNQVARAANRLVFQTGYIVKTVRDRTQTSVRE